MIDEVPQFGVCKTKKRVGYGGRHRNRLWGFVPSKPRGREAGDSV